jgi:hypothetical protein
MLIRTYAETVRNDISDHAAIDEAARRLTDLDTPPLAVMIDRIKAYGQSVQDREANYRKTALTYFRERCYLTTIQLQPRVVDTPRNGAGSTAKALKVQYAARDADVRLQENLAAQRKKDHQAAVAARERTPDAKPIPKHLSGVLTPEKRRLREKWRKALQARQ